MRYNISYSFVLSNILFNSLIFKFTLLCTSDQIRSDQSLSCVRLFATPWIAARQASLSITNSRSSLRLTSIESVMPSKLYLADTCLFFKSLLTEKKKLQRMLVNIKDILMWETKSQNRRCILTLGKDRWRDSSWNRT